MTLFLYLIIVTYQWDILWVADLAVYAPADRTAIFTIFCLAIFADYNLYKIMQKQGLKMETSQAIKELLIRKGIKPTGDSWKDMVLAKSVMPPPYKKESKK